MKKIYLLLILVLFSTACAKEPKLLYGSDGREIPMVFQNFPDIPFPDDSYLSIEDSRTMGSEVSSTCWVTSGIISATARKMLLMFCPVLAEQ